MDELPILEPAPTAEDALRRRLLNRIVIAALIVVGLLGSLAMFEALYTPPPPVTAKLTLPPRQEPAAPPETKRIAPAAEPAVAAKPEEKPVPERTAAPGAPPLQAPPGREAAQSPVAAQRAAASRPVTQAVERRYALQMGVFSNVANAEDLRAKLAAQGIPASIEARVHAGPFRTREEVDAARAKLKALGFDDGLLITLKK